MDRILIIGKEPKDFVQPIQSYLNQEGYFVDVLEFRGGVDGLTLSSRFDLNNYSLKDYFKQLFSQNFWKYFSNTFSLKDSLRLSLLSRFFEPIFKPYDIINFQCMEPLNLDLLRIISPNQKVICSFWGSDLHTQNQRRIDFLRKYLYKADAITLHSPEMKETLTAKIPSVNANRVHFQLFGLRNDFFEAYEKVMAKSANRDLIRDFNLPENKFLVMLGYCSKPVANQLIMLQHLNSLGSEWIEKVHLIIPSTYGKPDYQHKLKESLKKSKFSYSLIEEFLSLEKLVELKLLADVYVHGNKSDAFSNSMLENIYCSSICLIADWLPYSRLREAGIYYHSFSSFDELAMKMKLVLNTIEEEKLKVKGNAIRIKDNFGEDAVVLNWHKMIRDLNE